MSKVYRTALGKTIDMDQLRLNNEATIAVGNMKINARGDELGPGGEIIRTRNDIMNEYYKLNTPIVESAPRIVPDETALAPKQPEPINPSGLRGSLADLVSKTEKK